MQFIRSKFSRRIRKKKRIGEFRRFGFSMDVYCGPDPEGKIVDPIIDILISKRMDCTGGGDGEKYQFFIDGIQEEKDKEFVCEEIKKIEGVTDVVSYGIVDVWHDNADLYFEGIDNLRKEYGKEG
jgi:uncharacterized protein YggL (DUF469 family)